ncbi:hypothetical protein A9R00_05650 [Oleispira antarctica]|uniref:PepSY domain-containing protein n=1 Tax=Oleispira antarctica TaxID=188908 RepID=A0A1Y5HT90_OLEAN|nr:hypothetical protein A9R00_05650 [Oleispira antarctica]
MKQLFNLKQLAALIISSVLFSATAFGHGDHSHDPISAEKAQVVATKIANQFTKNDAGLGFGKLPLNWLDLPAEQSSLHKQGKGYYIVKLDNNDENKSLYVLMSNTGEAYDANFSGEFKDLK